MFDVDVVAVFRKEYKNVSCIAAFKEWQGSGCVHVHTLSDFFLRDPDGRLRSGCCCRLLGTRRIDTFADCVEVAQRCVDDVGQMFLYIVRCQARHRQEIFERLHTPSWTGVERPA